MKSRVKVAIASALMLVSSSALAGIIFVPINGVYTDPDLAAVRVQDNGSGSARIRTTGLTGELALDASDLPEGLFSVDVPGCGQLTLEQELDLTIDRPSGDVEGRSRGRIRLTPEQVLDFQAEARGNASCVRRNGRQCSQLVVDLELRGTLSDRDDPARVGLVSMQTVGSLVRDGESGRWAALSMNASLGLLPELLDSVLDTIVERESCGG